MMSSAITKTAKRELRRQIGIALKTIDANDVRRQSEHVTEQVSFIHREMCLNFVGAHESNIHIRTTSIDLCEYGRRDRDRRNHFACTIDRQTMLHTSIRARRRRSTNGSTRFAVAIR